jgi:5-enolpyruvylshikimate-3-phosphate synthase
MKIIVLKNKNLWQPIINNCFNKEIPADWSSATFILVAGAILGEDIENKWIRYHRYSGRQAGS